MPGMMLEGVRGPNRTGENERTPRHGGPRSMTAPLVVLGILSAVGGFLNVPAFMGGSARLEHWLAPALEGPPAPAPPTTPAAARAGEWILVALAVAIALLGIGPAWRLPHPPTPTPPPLAP